jgi:uncharacterized protein YprB with RNaseH-like and TPR domain
MASNLKSRLARLREMGLKTASEALLETGVSGSGTGSTIGSEPLGGMKKGTPSRLAKTRRSVNDVPAKGRGADTSLFPGFLVGWKQLADLVFARKFIVANPLPETISALPFFQGLAVPAGRRSWPPKSIPGAENRLASSDLRFFDLETTGLSGGAGTIAFLACVGAAEGSDFVIRQFFLRDYPGEAAFIDALLEALGPRPLLASYNGRAFDLPLLRGRCVMNGRRLSEPRDHMDVLYPARRLWKRTCGGASLALLETLVLGRTRIGDVPGSLIPEIWFEFLSKGDHPLMPAVFSHNADDVANLARLAALIDRIFNDPLRLAEPSHVDLHNLGRLLIGLGRGKEAEEMLEMAAVGGDQRAGLRLLRLLRRSGRSSEARRCLPLAGEGFDSAMEELRIAERLEGDIPAALEAAKRAADLARNEIERGLAQRRIGRLERARGLN